METTVKKTIMEQLEELDDSLTKEERYHSIKQILIKELAEISDYLVERNISFINLFRTIDFDYDQEVIGVNFVGYGKEDTHRLSFIAEKMVELINGEVNEVYFKYRE